jgi:hypothetical protein
LTTAKLLFPEWVNRARLVVGVPLAGVPLYLLFLLYFAGAPSTTDVGYAPEQPVPYSHLVHAGQMGLDCRYCHTTVETAAFAAVPPTSVCMNCHRTIAPDVKNMEPVRQSAQSGGPIPWVRVHDLPDFVYFDHRAHVGRGVGCVSCHGRIDGMERVYQVKTLSMGFCLECHRDPAPQLRPLAQVTNLGWTADEDPRQLGQRLMAEMSISPSTDCSTCHR